MSEMKLVPVEPTDEMVEATFDVWAGFPKRSVYGERSSAIYAAMLSAAPVVSVGGVSGSSAQEADTHRATDGTVLAFRILYDCAQDVRTALDAEPAMQGPKYRSLGITFTTALDVAREALRDHQAATPDGSQWRPIETAPKDGTRVMVYPYNAYDSPGFTVAHYATGWAGAFQHASERTGWWNGCYLGPQPTHWMPLPAAPEGGNE